MPHIETLTARFRPHAGTEARDVLATVAVRSDDYHFTVYDGQGRPVGSIHRPRADNADRMNRKWSAYRTDGRTVCTTAPGPRIALTRIARQLIDESGLVGTIALESDAPAAPAPAPVEAAKVARTISIDMTPTWEETASVLFTLATRGDSKGQDSALQEMRRMGRLADMAMVITGGHRRDDAPAPCPMPDMIKAAVAFLQGVTGDDMAAAMLSASVETARAAEMLRTAPARAAEMLRTAPARAEAL